MKKLSFIIGLAVTITIYAVSAFAQDNFHLIATMTGEKTGDLFSVVAGVGDLNGDGYDDVLVGAPDGNYAKLYFGGAPFDTVADLKLVCEQGGSRFGWSVAGGGDVNGDGFPDIVIGAPYYALGGKPFGIKDAGKVYVYFGGAQMDTTTDVTMTGADWYYNFGHSVSMAGDVNADAYDDIIAGAWNDEYDAHGRVYIYFGGAAMDSVADVLIEGAEHFDMLGWSVSGAGDVNRDGYDDVTVGAPHRLGTLPHVGKAYLFYGSSQMSMSHSIVFEEDNSTIRGAFGRVVSGLGDINNDGFVEFGIMSDYLLQIRSTKGLLVNVIADTGWAAFQYISGGGDINRDGFLDMFVGVQNEVAQYAGMAVIYLGSTTFNTIPDYEIMGQTQQNYFASSIAYAGDINNDGYGEIVIGEHQGFGWNGPGKVYIYSFGFIDDIREKKSIDSRTWFRLYQNYPNPFNASTEISYDLSSPSFVTLDIFNCMGQKLKTLVSEQQMSGSHRVVWDGKDENGQPANSGIYFVRLLVQSFDLPRKTQTEFQKITLIK